IVGSYESKISALCCGNLGSTVSHDLKWESNINTIRKKAQQRMYFLQQLRKFNLPQELLIQFYTAIIPVFNTVEKIIGASLPPIQDLNVSRVRKRAANISAGPSNPGHNLFQLLPSGRLYRALYTKTTRHKNSFFPQAVTLMNI
ncbi:hypothetical protein L3Q82_016980, partial [Scortum barcoo]